MSSNKQATDEDERGFFDPQTNTFYKVKNEEIYQKVLKFMEEQEKVKKEEQFKKRMEEEKFDDFDDIVQQTMKKKWKLQDVELIQYDL